MSANTPATPRVGYLVDVQNDFMRSAAPGGRLYVRHLNDPADPGAEQIIPTLARLARWMYEHCDVVVLSGDWHGPEDAEIDAAAPDFRTTYPPHCMGRSTDAAEREGAALIPEVAPADPLVLHVPEETHVMYGASVEHVARLVGERAARERRPVFVHKTQFSVWTGNAGMDELVRALSEGLGARPEFVLAGVASDVCDDAAVRGLRERGYAVTVVRDAIHSLGSKPDEAILADWEALGARTTTLAELAG
jgi:nicotinamidase/pyrazinamidase